MSVDAPPQPAQDIDSFDEVLATLPLDIQDIVTAHSDGLLEIRMVFGYPLVLNLGGRMLRFDLTIDKRNHVDFIRDKIGGFKEDGRAGLNGTLHRYSAVPDRYNSTVGIVIRLARAHTGAAAALSGPLSEHRQLPVKYDETGESRAAETLEGLLADPTMSMMMVGRPGSHKTTLLRDIARVSSIPAPEGYGLDQLCVVVDTSGEVAGYGARPHPAVGHALRIEVGEPKHQAAKLKIAIRNLTASRLIVDEIGFNNDVEQIQACANLGVGVFCTLHGYDLRDVVNNAVYWPLFGMQERSGRIGKVTFRMCLELRGPERWVLYLDLGAAVDAILAGRPPSGVLLGSGW